MTRIAWLLVLIAGLAFADDSARTPPAFRLGDAATPNGYEVHLAIDPRQPAFSGEVRIELRVNRPIPVLWLNATKLSIDSVQVRQGERAIAVDVIEGGEDFVGLRARGEPLAAGDTVAVVRYKGPLDPLSTHGLFRQQEQGEWYVISQFETLHARRAFPCFDEPAWKTPWRITIDAPAADAVVSNTPEVRAVDLADRPGWRRHEFARTKPLPSYLVALAVGPFDVVDGGTAGINRIPLRYFAPKGRGAETRYARESTPRLLELLEAYFGMPYPYEKLDAVSIPQSVNFGAMENVGMITYGTFLLLATPREETFRFKRRYAAVAAHEIAHMWFGNLVTLAWWDDVWLNEAFASWIGQKILYRFKPEWDTGDWRARSRGAAIAIDRLASARRVHNPVLAKGDVDSGFDSITYDKGSAVLEMFEAWLGKENFRKGVRDYLKGHAFGSATSRDFFQAIGGAAGRGDEALAAFTAFVDQSGVPLIDVALRCEGTRPSIVVSQHRLRPVGSKADDREWTTPACFRHGAATQCEEIRNATRSIALSKAPACPGWILGNAGGAGHYVVRYDAALMSRLLKDAAALPVHETVALVSDGALLAESGLLPLDAALDLAGATLRHSSGVVRLAAVRLLEKLRDPWLDDARSKAKRLIVAKRVQPLARELGWRGKGRERDDVADLRVTLLPFAAERESGAALRAQARSLALAWLRDRDAIPALMVAPVLDTAARFADRSAYEALEALALTSQIDIERRPLLSALGKVRDPQLRARALSLTLLKKGDSEAMNGREVLLFLEDALHDEANRLPAFEFVRANFDALAAKMPLHTPGQLARALKDLCTPQDRATFVDFFKPRSVRFDGGERHFDEALETIDLCIAARAAGGSGR